MGDEPGCNSMIKSTSLCRGNPDSLSGNKHPHTLKSPVTPRSEREYGTGNRRGAYVH